MGVLGIVVLLRLPLFGGSDVSTKIYSDELYAKELFYAARILRDAAEGVDLGASVFQVIMTSKRLLRNF